MNRGSIDKHTANNNYPSCPSIPYVTIFLPPTISHSLTLHIHSTRYRVCVLYLVVCYIVCFVPVRWILISSEWGRGDVEQQQQHATCIVSLWSQQTPPLLCSVPQHNCRPRLPVPHTSHADSNWTTIKARALYSALLFSVVCVTTIN